MRRLTTLVAITCALAAVVPGVGAAATPAADRDCNAHGGLTQHYSAAQLRTALSEMPADEQEYTNCYDVIQRQLLAQISGSHTSGTGAPQPQSDSSFLPTPVIVAIVVLALGGATLGAVAIRRRSSP
jgi:hypothetical protein